MRFKKGQYIQYNDDVLMRYKNIRFDRRCIIKSDVYATSYRNIRTNEVFQLTTKHVTFYFQLETNDKFLQNFK